MKNKIEDIDFLIYEIRKQIDLILCFFDEEKKQIRIHLKNTQENEEDIARSLFVISSLTRSKDFLSEDQVDILSKLNNSYTEKGLAEKNYIAILYSLRICHFFNKEKEKKELLGFLENSISLSDLKKPVAAYIFLSTYDLLHLDFKNYPFLISIKNHLLSLFDCLIFSDLYLKQQIFALTEVFYWKSPDLLSESFRGQVVKNIEKYYSLLKRDNFQRVYSSGLLKTAEHFSLCGDHEKVEDIINFLEKNRKISSEDYLKIKRKDISLYREKHQGDYVCLDSHAHLLNTLLNLYESIDRNN